MEPENRMIPFRYMGDCLTFTKKKDIEDALQHYVDHYRHKTGTALIEETHELVLRGIERYLNDDDPWSGKSGKKPGLSEDCYGLILATKASHKVTWAKLADWCGLSDSKVKEAKKAPEGLPVDRCDYCAHYKLLFKKKNLSLEWAESRIREMKKL